eukprot:evm.model.scf_204.5 EVM.evm.TU.scf_204.5   scf_204:22127-23885(+)
MTAVSPPSAGELPAERCEFGRVEATEGPLVLWLMANSDSAGYSVQICATDFGAHAWRANFKLSDLMDSLTGTCPTPGLLLKWVTMSMTQGRMALDLTEGQEGK